MPEGWPDMLDIALGTVNREDLDANALIPERQLWCNYGIGWVKEIATNGMGEDIPRHPSYKVNEISK